MKYSIISLLLAVASATPVAGPQLEKRQGGKSASDPSPQITFASVFSPKSYDFIVVGAGTSGAVVARRLADANPSWKVALLEAGDDPNVGAPYTWSTPGLDAFGIGWYPNSTNGIDWNVVTEPQAGLASRKMHYARGKALGGTSNRNFMIYQAGSDSAYDQWAQLTGDDTWKWANVKSYFQKSAKFTGPKPSRFANATPVYDANAYAYSPASAQKLPVTFPAYANSFTTYLYKALQQYGIPVITDFFQGKLLGVQYTVSTIDPDDMTRTTSNTAYLHGPPSNLFIYKTAYATKINFDGNKVATSVDFTTSGVKYTFTASKEIIVSAGFIESPHLLMLSGVGPRSQLQQFGIPVISDLPGVGQMVQDHLFTTGPTWAVNLETEPRIANDYIYAAGKLVEFQTSHTGIFTNPICDMISYERFDKATLQRLGNGAEVLDSYPAGWPHAEYLSAPGLVKDFGDLPFQQPKDGRGYSTVLISLAALQSNGTVTLKSADPNVLPAVDPKWLTSPIDQVIAVEAFKRARKIWEQPAFSSIKLGGAEYFPGPSVQTDAQILEVIRNNAQTEWHGSCSMKMGRLSDNAVLDSRFRVYGVSKLRVIDSSSMPKLVPGHPQGTMYMLGEKGADFIANDYR